MCMLFLNNIWGVNYLSRPFCILTLGIVLPYWEGYEMYIINKEVTMKDGSITKYTQKKAGSDCPFKYVNKKVAERIAKELTEMCGEDIYPNFGEISAVFKIEEFSK